MRAVTTYDLYARMYDMFEDLTAADRISGLARFSGGGRPSLGEVFGVPWLFDPDTVLGGADEKDWHGEVRNENVAPLTVNVSFQQIGNQSTIQFRTPQGQPNVRWLYLLIEETLASGKKLPTYVDVSMTTNVVYLPREFFRREQNCRNRDAEILDDLSRRLRETNDKPPLGSPVTATGQTKMLQQIRRESPELVEPCFERGPRNSRTLSMQGGQVRFLVCPE